MKRTHRSSSQSTSVIFVFVMVDECLARVEHAAGTKRAGGELVAHGRRVARGGQRGASVLDGASEWGQACTAPRRM
jgi:hypothetical protein